MSSHLDLTVAMIGALAIHGAGLAWIMGEQSAGGGAGNQGTASVTLQSAPSELQALVDTFETSPDVTPAAQQLVQPTESLTTQNAPTFSDAQPTTVGPQQLAIADADYMAHRSLSRDLKLILATATGGGRGDAVKDA